MPDERSEEMPSNLATLLDDLTELLQDRKKSAPEGSYVASLYRLGEDKILEKVGEEALETILAVKNQDRPEIIREMADLWFHLLVLLAHRDIHPREILAELASRMELPRKSKEEAEKRVHDRRMAQKKLVLHLYNGMIIQGESQDVSLNGLLLRTDYEPKWQLIGEKGYFELTIDHRTQNFPCEVVRTTRDGVGLRIEKDWGAFGFALSQDIFTEML